MDIAITGVTGLIGAKFKQRLAASGHRVLGITRSPGGASDMIGWDLAAGTVDAAGLEGVDAVVHLAGEPIAARRWSEAQRARLVDSRVVGTTLIAEAITRLAKPPGVLLSGSAIGFYGNRPGQSLTEASRGGEGFLPDLCRAWEAATAPAEEAGIRVAHLRTGIVLTPDGGALAKLVPLVKLGLGGKMGSGDQVMSWISIEDQLAMMEWLLTASVAGPVNLTAPNPVTNRELTAELGSALGRPTLLSVPKFGPKLLLGGDMAQALLFDDARILPEVATGAGYEFVHPTLGAAFGDILSH